MAALKSEHKALIVQRLATFVAPAEIVAELRDFGVVVPFSQIAYYDPTIAGSDLAKRWKHLHTTTRVAFLRETAPIAIAHRNYRLRELDSLYRLAKARKNYPMAAGLLEQAAKEMGEAYTNRRVIGLDDPLESMARLLGV